ncbi:MAG: hypothetical protein AAFY20_09300 [Cyanobacteria bacterium J06639_14]
MDYLLYIKKSTNPDFEGRSLWANNLDAPNTSVTFEGITFRPNNVKISQDRVVAQNEHFYVQCLIAGTRESQ